jgi:hypothetical protein
MRVRVLARTALVTVAIVVAGVLVTLAAHPARAATATFIKYGEWSTGYVGAISVTNNTAATTTSWRIELDLPAGTTMTSSWSAVVERSGDHYVFTNMPWNGTLTPGASTSFGFVTEGLGSPVICSVNGESCSGDREPPTTPGNLRASVSGIEALLSWDASTDNVGVVGYLVFLNDQPTASLTPATSVRISLPGPFGFLVSVVAVDAAGNRSVPATTNVSTETGPTTPTPSRTA